MSPRPRSLAAQWITAVAFLGFLGVAVWFSFGPWSLPDDHDAILGMAIPVLLGGAAFAAATFGQPLLLWILSGVLLVFSVLAVFSIGLFILPFALLLIVAAGLAQLAWDRARWAARATTAPE